MVRGPPVNPDGAAFAASWSHAALHAEAHRPMTDQFSARIPKGPAGVAVLALASLVVVLVVIAVFDRLDDRQATTPQAANRNPTTTTPTTATPSLAVPTTTTTTPTTTAPSSTSPSITSPSVTTAPATTLPASTTTVLPPVPALWIPGFGETQPDGKGLGAAIVADLTNYDPGDSFTDIAASLTNDPTAQNALLDAAAAVLHPDTWSRGTVEYAQLGGLTADRTSIMVVVRQELGGTEPRVERRTFDVRLIRDALGAWTFDRLASAGGEVVARPDDLSEAAAAVLADERIGLADSAIWDIYSGHTSDPLLRLMSELAEVTPFDAVVLHTGHPFNVFETDRISNHSVGRAIDIYRFGDELVINGRFEGSLTQAVTRDLSQRTDVSELGSPWKFAEATTASFTNEVHQDHIHLVARG